MDDIQDTQQTEDLSEQNNQQDPISFEKLQTDLTQALEGWKRTAADFDNYRRRKEAENQELVSFAREVTVAKLLPSLDSLEQALKHMPQVNDELQIISSSEFGKQYQNWQSGIKGLITQLDKALEELGVKRIAAVGKKFDPNFHEAIREVESEHDDGTVIDELQTGFELNGKLVRPSQVVISKKRFVNQE